MYIYVCVYTHVQTSLFSLSLSLEILEQQSSFVRTIWNSLVRGWIGIAKNPDIEISGMEKWGWMRAVFPRIGKCGGNSFDPFEGSERGGILLWGTRGATRNFRFAPFAERYKARGAVDGGWNTGRLKEKIRNWRKRGEERGGGARKGEEGGNGLPGNVVL